MKWKFQPPSHVHIKSLQLYLLISFKSIAIEQSKKNDIIW